ncbi:MAG: alkaline phosphatase D family protein, partial [Solirubrobacteraceae bacterium]
MSGPHVSRRELLAAGAVAGAALHLPGAAVAGPSAWTERLDFSALGPGDGWPGWTCSGTANMRRADALGLLEAGSDVFPCDPRPVAFAVDRRSRDLEIRAVVEAAGAGTGLVLRRVGPRDYYAAIYDNEQRALVLVRRGGFELDELARVSFVGGSGPLRMAFSARGRGPTVLEATLEQAGALPVTVHARDAVPALQGPGDPGVLATARTLFPSEGPPVLPALGNLHLLPYGVQEGQAIIGSPIGRPVLDTIRERSTAAFREITVTGSGRRLVTPPAVVAAVNGTPIRGGATLRVASDLPARVQIELAFDPAFKRSRLLPAERTNAFGAHLAPADGLPPGRRVYWRARLRRRGHETVGPVRSFRSLPAAGNSARTTLAIGSCAIQFGPIFDHIADRRPDVFVWQGDLNYPDTVGPLAQTVPGYAGIWRDFLANPRLAPIAERTPFAAQRDDHDYGVQDANAGNLVPWGLAPWRALMERRLYHRFSAGLADVWVLDQRRHKSDPGEPDSEAKTLLGPRQRAWLLKTLAASSAPFKVICSPCTLAPLPANQRDGSWAAGYTAERDLLLDHLANEVPGRTVFVTGDTHWTMAYESEGLFEARPCPMGIPTPNDITLTQPQAAEDARAIPGVVYADDERAHVAFLAVSGRRGVARLDLTLERDDG